MVTIGGGGGQAAVVQAIQDLDLELVALCNTVDDGGSTGKLMQEYGVGSVGDLRRVISAMSEYEKFLEYRFSKGSLTGHSLGNLWLAGLQLSGDSYESAAGRASKMMQVRHTVAPLTVRSPVLHARTVAGQEITGQRAIVVQVRSSTPKPYETIWIEPADVPLSQVARAALQSAEVVILTMGDLYSSVAPAFCVKELRERWSALRARVVWLPNFAITPGHLHYERVSKALQFLQTLNPYFQPQVIVAHDGTLAGALRRRLDQKGYGISRLDLESSAARTIIKEDLLDHHCVPAVDQRDAIERSPVRYDRNKLKKALERVIYGETSHNS